MAWCGSQKAEIIDPYFLSEPVVNGENQKGVLYTFAILKLSYLPGSQLVPQYGAPPHWTIDG